MKNIVEVAMGNPDFSTLVAAVKAADLVETLSGGSFTVFAPTNSAFSKALSALNLTAEQLLGNKELLTKVLTYHVVPGVVKAADVMKLQDGTMVKTVQGSELKVSNVGGVKVDEANVTTTDIECSNGVIHVIDSVIMPK
jgi:uncharacterized surface protein with fasciclin (FAS1) repeats